jgi:hypothetical protein
VLGPSPYSLLSLSILPDQKEPFSLQYCGLDFDGEKRSHSSGAAFDQIFNSSFQSDWSNPA